MGYEYSYDSGTAVAAGLGLALGLIIFVWIIAIGISVFSIICNWKVYKKAGKNGWEAIVPIYNIIVLLEITNLPMWYLILLLIPIANIVVMFLVYIELAKKFGQSAAFGIGLVFINPVFMAILAFNKNYVYQAAIVAPNYNSQVNYNNQYYQQSNYNQSVQPQQEYTQSTNCSRCGAPVNQDDKFCMHCGNQLQKV